MAQIFDAEDTTSAGRRAVIKILKKAPDLSGENHYWEGELLKQMVHPGVVRVFACGKKRGRYFIVMERLDGPDLKRRIKESHPSLNGKRLWLMNGIAKAVEYVHKRRVIHRDITPNNILFRGEMPVLVDFGLAVTEFDKLHRSVIRKGTPSYMAPELLLEHKVDKRTDIYAFGVLMYELVVGRTPFADGSVMGTLSRGINVEPVPPSRLKRGVSARFDRVVMRAVHKDPRKRFQDMEDLLFELSGLKPEDLGD